MSARRRAKAIARRQWLLDLDVRWAFRNDRLPLYAESVAICSCGRRAWLMPGATPEEREEFDMDNEAHDYAHSVEDDIA